MDPRVSDPQAIFAARGAGCDLSDLVEMAAPAHCQPAYDARAGIFTSPLAGEVRTHRGRGGGTELENFGINLRRGGPCCRMRSDPGPPWPALTVGRAAQRPRRTGRGSRPWPFPAARCGYG